MNIIIPNPMPNTAKQESIRKAYGEYWERFHTEIKEEVIQLDGWLDWLSLNDLNVGELFFEIFNDLDIDFDYDKERLRPKSLQGIENNREWILLNSESDLPEHGTLCWFIYNEESYCGRFFYGFFQSNDILCGWRAVTHYQPIVKPENPIY